MTTYVIEGSRAGEALQALRNMAASDFDACFRVAESSATRVVLEDIIDPSNQFAVAIEDIVKNELPATFGVTVTQR